MTSRYWLLTINNPDKEFEDYQHDNISILVGQQERGAQGTLHWQLYVEFKNPVRIGSVKSVFSGCHAEKRRGTRADAFKYCTKDDSRESGPFYRGISRGDCESIISGRASSTTQARILNVKRMIDDGRDELEIANEEFELWVRYYRAFERYRMLSTTPRNHEMTVIVCQGPTGTGKSRWALDNFGGGYWKQRSQWWDGYSKHDTVILDEFYGWLPFDLLLRLCDRYPLLVETKGGQVHMVAKTIIITTNSRPDRWYNNVYFHSFIRRVTTWKLFTGQGEVSDYDYYPADVMIHH